MTREASLAPTLAERTESLVLWWACALPNRLLDRAGSYRRLACGLTLVPVPLMMLGAVVFSRGLDLGVGPWPLEAHAAALLGFPGACLWVAGDLIRRGSLLGRWGLPIPGLLAMTADTGLLIGLRPADVVVTIGPRPATAPAVAAVLLGLVILVAAEWSRNRLLFVTGRWLLTGGVALLGGAALWRAVALDGHERWYAAGLAGLALVLILTAYFEARVLIRGAELYRRLTRR